MKKILEEAPLCIKKKKERKTPITIATPTAEGREKTLKKMGEKKNSGKEKSGKQKCLGKED